MNPRDWHPLLVMLAGLAMGIALLLLLRAAARASEPSPVRAVCADLLAEWRPVPRPERAARVATCERLAELAEEAGPHVALVLALGYHETHYDPTPRRLCGPLQVARRYHCPGCTHRDCEAAGVRLLGRLMSEQQGSERVALRRWLVGPRGRSGPLDRARERWIGAVLWTARRIERRLAAADGGPET